MIVNTTNTKDTLATKKLKITSFIYSILSYQRMLKMLLQIYTFPLEMDHRFDRS